jgi:hypothetical protein
MLMPLGIFLQPDYFGREISVRRSFGFRLSVSHGPPNLSLRTGLDLDTHKHAFVR